MVHKVYLASATVLGCKTTINDATVMCEVGLKFMIIIISVSITKLGKSKCCTKTQAT